MNFVNFQKAAWRDFFSRSLQGLLNSKSFSCKGVDISFEALNANSFLKTPIGDSGTHKQTLKILIKISHSSGTVEIPKDLIVLPVFSGDGFLIDNVKYALVSTFRLASGWYIKNDPKGGLMLTLQRESTPIFTVECDTHSGMVVKFNASKGEMPLFEFLHAVSGMPNLTDADLLDNFSDCLNITNAYDEWVQSPGYTSRTLSDVSTSAYRALRGIIRETDYTDPISLLADYFAQNGMRMHSEKIPRFKRFTSFARARGTRLVENITACGETFEKGTVLTEYNLRKIDRDDSVISLHVCKDDILYTLKKMPVTLALTFDELCCALRVYDQALSGMGIIDDQDEQFNRVIHTVRDEYEQFVENAINGVVKELTRCINGCPVNDYVEYICANAQLDDCVSESTAVDYIKSGNSAYQQIDETNSLSSFEQGFRITSGLKHVVASARDIHPSEYGRVCPYTTSESNTNL